MGRGMSEWKIDQVRAFKLGTICRTDHVKPAVPELKGPKDVIIKTTSAALCGR